MKKLSALIGIVILLIIVCALFGFAFLGREYVSSSSADITRDQAKQIALQDAGESIEDVTFTRNVLEKDNDRLVYHIDFYTDDISYQYLVDSTTGSIYRKDTQTVQRVAKSEEYDLDQANSTADGTEGYTDQAANQTTDQTSNQVTDQPNNQTTGQINNQDDRSDQTNQPGQTDKTKQGTQAAQPEDALSYIGVEQAKAIALEDAGLTGKAVTFDKVKLKHENSQVVYDVEFKYKGMEYEYDLDASTGAIVDKDVEIDD